MELVDLCTRLVIFIWTMCCVAFIPIAFGAGYGTKNLFNQESFNECISTLIINTSQPTTTELDLLIACGYIPAILLCCSCFAAMNGVSRENKMYSSIGCLWLLIAIVGSALFMHLFTYLNEINGPNVCTSDVNNFQTVFHWATAGVVIGSFIVSLTCCFICCFALIAAAAGDADKQQGGGANERTVVNPRGGRGRQQQQQGLSAADQRYVGALLSLAVVEECGFCIATENNRYTVLNKLNNVNCLGQTALRDAVIYGIQKMLALKVVLSKLGAIQHKFIHIVLTDGMDNRSQCTLTDTQRIFLQLGREIGDICTTFFIGIGLGYQERAQLQSIADLGGDAAELYNCQDVQLSDVFNRIKLRVGIRRDIAVVTDGRNILAAQRDQLYLTAEQQKFLVLFTLDKSGSMSGGRWRRVCGAVNGFCQGMGQHDILGVILFNEKVVCITE